MIIKLSDETIVTTKDKMNASSRRDIKIAGGIFDAMLSPVKELKKTEAQKSEFALKEMLELQKQNEENMKVVAMERLIISIEKEGKKIPLTREWLDELDAEDEDLIYKEIKPLIDKFTKPKKN